MSSVDQTKAHGPNIQAKNNVYIFEESENEKEYVTQTRCGLQSLKHWRSQPLQKSLPLTGLYNKRWGKDDGLEDINL